MRPRIAKGIRFAIAHKAQVINMSFNFECGERVPMVDEALRDAYQHGIVTVASAGNLGADECVAAPATGPRVIGSAAPPRAGCLGSYSLAGAGIDLVAPGGGEPQSRCPSVAARPIYQVTLRPDTTDEFAIPANYIGTSMAAAHVSGVAAMVLASGGRQPRAAAGASRSTWCASSYATPPATSAFRAPSRAPDWSTRPGDGDVPAVLPAGEVASAQVVRTMMTLQGAWWETLLGTLPSR